MSPSIVQRAGLDDVEEMHCLIRDTLTEDFSSFTDEARANYIDTWSRDQLRQQVSNGDKLSLTASQDGKLQGIVVGNTPEAGVATIIWLLVKSPYQSLGVGALLFEHACRLYQEQGLHKVKLTASNKRARDFYVSQGMQEEGFHPQHWWKIDFWVLGKLLDQ
ncbi:MAG TPA: GNAT family N-acetyltransferase [Myxococcales bacterium]|nr:GNAT family N-acetyltransferase [Myxococcales bacterium]